MNTLRDLLQGQYNVKTDILENIVTVTTTPTRILGNNPNRLSYLVGNTGAVTLYFAHSATLLSPTQGLPVGGGNSIGGDWRVDFDVVGYELWAVAAAGSVVVFSYEVVTAGQTPKE